MSHLTIKEAFVLVMIMSTVINGSNRSIDYMIIKIIIIVTIF